MCSPINPERKHNMHSFNVALFWAELPIVGAVTIVFTVITSLMMLVLHWYGHVGRGVVAGLISSAVFGLLGTAALGAQCYGIEPYFPPYTLYDKYPEFAVNLLNFVLLIVQLAPVLAPFFWIFYKLQKWSEPQED